MELSARARPSVLTLLKGEEATTEEVVTEVVETGVGVAEEAKEEEEVDMKVIVYFNFFSCITDDLI